MAEYTDWSESKETKKPGGDGKSARQSVSQVKQEAVQRGKGMAEEQKESAARTAHRIAAALEDVASDLQNDQPQVASVFRSGARGLDNLAQTLRERDTDSLFRQAQDFARRQPAVVIGGTIAAGFFLSRLLKSSPDREEQPYTGIERRSAPRYGSSTFAGTEEPLARREDIGTSTTVESEENIYGRE